MSPTRAGTTAPGAGVGGEAKNGSTPTVWVRGTRRMKSTAVRPIWSPWLLSLSIETCTAQVPIGRPAGTEQRPLIGSTVRPGGCWKFGSPTSAAVESR